MRVCVALAHANPSSLCPSIFFIVRASSVESFQSLVLSSFLISFLSFGLTAPSFLSVILPYFLPRLFFLSFVFVRSFVCLLCHFFLSFFLPPVLPSFLSSSSLPPSIWVQRWMLPKEALSGHIIFHPLVKLRLPSSVFRRIQMIQVSTEDGEGGRIEWVSVTDVMAGSSFLRPLVCVVSHVVRFG